MQLASFLKATRRLKHKQVLQFVQRCWKKIVTDDEFISSEYKQWRHGFILKRLYLMIWVSIIGYLLDALVDWIIIVPSLEPNSSQYYFFQQNRELMYGTLIVFFLELLLTLWLLKITFIRRYPILIFLWLNWTLLLTPPIIFAIFLRQNIPDFAAWWITFPAEVILLPVRWQWHLLSQGITLVHFAFNYFLFGFSHPLINYEINYFAYVYCTIVVCSIANLGAFLYERLLQQEFESRRQLRLFLHTVSHDLRNPVLGNMFLLKSLRNSNAEETIVKNEILDQIIVSSDRHLQLINSLLEAYNTETKGIIVLPRPVRLDNLVKSVIMEMQPLLEKEGAIAIAKTSTTLPIANIDPLQIRRVYENLIVNALEHNRSGLRLILEAKSDYSLSHSRKKTNLNRWIYCTVSDNGEGITPQQSSRLFDLYTGASSTKQSISTGLGLYICRQIINAHGGEIGVDIGIDSTRQGSSFWFTLPIATKIDNSY